MSGNRDFILWQNSISEIHAKTESGQIEQFADERCDHAGRGAKLNECHVSAKD
ncbi:hypothetical protein RSSM_05330 [Rhodopirellula sallentina SM41]|uniref:Uncharacterized protein n=1 Tax=Rhodopirellula sallentina SM41 TaxID=1263870 RepID=M5U5V3_9BACT|nr:hypothetical protein RSSM_05330 [Rhodopirellula sallentina SM41]